MKDLSWLTVAAFAIAVVGCSAIWFAVGFLAGGIEMYHWIQAHP